MSNTPPDRIAGNDQSYLIPANTETTKNFGSLVIQEDDTEITVLEESKIDRDESSPTYGQRVAVDVLSEQNISGVTLKKGAIITPRRGYFITVEADKDLIGYLLLGPQEKMNDQ